MGDTALFGDMTLIADRYRPDLVLIPIGGHFVMDPNDAAAATRILHPNYAMPMHYGTIPQLAGTPAHDTAPLQGATSEDGEIQRGGPTAISAEYERRVFP